ncbi:MAG: DUF502 domain-containing protein [Gammaproteobacteria bacterium]|nr:DUF502 domain-containing protein [Gammaproteobacteria bacterium]MDE0489324.1 DUF502 domain-containing protein [Gammaproteobacteria bacterium]MYH32762.1 DUF502 domain-containing protein [Gammaproteobacteria bacterium]MYL01576.1 DUF502 domain-containing protein [Gammaproteobacteria bacterium]
MFRNWWPRLRRVLVAGVLVWVPLGITVILLRFLIGLADQTLGLIPEPFQPEALLGRPIPGLGVVLSLVLLFLTGLVAANVVGKRFIGFWEALLRRIPVVKTIYTAAKGFLEMVLSGQSGSFSRVLLIEYPRKGIYCIAFQTSSTVGQLAEHTPDSVCVFVPTTPNPTSGFLVVAPEKDLIELNMSVEDAIKLVVSVGVVVPDPDNLPRVDADAGAREA